MRKEKFKKCRSIVTALVLVISMGCPTNITYAAANNDSEQTTINEGININEKFCFSSSQISSMVSTTEGSDKIVFSDIKDFKVGDGIALKELGAVADDDFKTWLVAEIKEIDGKTATLNVTVNETKSEVEVQHDNSYNLVNLSEYFYDKNEVKFYCESGEYNLYSHLVSGTKSIVPDKYGNGSGLLNLIGKDKVDINFNNAVFKNKSKIMLGASKGTRLYSFMTMKNCNNTTLKNLVVDHDTKNQLIAKKASYEYWTYGVTVHGGKNIVLENVSCNRIEADGIYIGHHRGDEVNKFKGELTGIKLINCKAIECGRQGLTVGGGNHILLDGCDFSYTGMNKDTYSKLAYQSSPSAGIDFELETGFNAEFDRSISNVTVKNCILNNNLYVLAGDSLNGDIVTFENCELTQLIPDGYSNSGVAGLFAYMPSYAKKVIFKGCRIEQYTKDTVTNSFIIFSPKIENEIIFDDCIIKGIGYFQCNANSNVIIRNSQVIADSNVGKYVSNFDANNRCTVENSIVKYNSRWFDNTNILAMIFNKISNSEIIIEDCSADKSLKLVSGKVMEHTKLSNSNHNKLTIEGIISTYQYSNGLYLYKNDINDNSDYENKLINNNTDFTGYNKYSSIKIEKLIDSDDNISDYVPTVIEKIIVNGNTLAVNWTLNNINEVVKKAAANNFAETVPDYIDYERGVYVRNIGYKEVSKLTATEIKKDTDNDAVYVTVKNIQESYFKNCNIVNYFCNALDSSLTWIGGYYKTVNAEYLTNNAGGSFSFHLFNSTLGTNSDSTKEEVIAAFMKWAENNNAMLYYNLKLPEITKFTPEVLNDLSSNKMSAITSSGKCDVNMITPLTNLAKLVTIAKRTDELPETENGWKYKNVVDENNSLAVESIEIANYNGTDKKVEVPSKINDSQVKRINEFAFYGNKSIEEIVIPNTIIEIGENAFENTSIHTIYGNRGSAAEKYANANNIKFVSLNQELNIEFKINNSANGITINKDETINLSVKGIGGASQYKYSFLVYNETTNSWYRFSEFTEQSNMIWTAGSTGNRIFYAEVKDSTGKIVRSSPINVKTINKDEELSVKGSITSNVSTVGTTLKISANASGGTGYKYKFIIHNKDNGSWFLLKDFGSENSIMWTAGSVGNREVFIDVKDNSGKIARSEAINIRVIAENELSVTGTANTLNTAVGETVTFTGMATGGSGQYLYKFVIHNKDNDSWYLLKNFGKDKSVMWTAGSAGNREIFVDVKDDTGKIVRSNAINIVTQ